MCLVECRVQISQNKNIAKVRVVIVSWVAWRFLNLVSGLKERTWTYETIRELCSCKHWPTATKRTKCRYLHGKLQVRDRREFNECHLLVRDRLSCLVGRVPGCRPRGPGFGSRRYEIFCIAVALEWGPLSLLRINEELLERKIAAPV
jgi:hypothetical protein